jgi:hypothetical protein
MITEYKPFNITCDKKVKSQIENWLNNLDVFTGMDSGAIYVATCNTDAVIRYNFIHDYCPPL